MEDYGDDAICGRAISRNQEVPTWEDQSFLLSFVDEAKRRGLTPEYCTLLIGPNYERRETIPAEHGNPVTILHNWAELYRAKGPAGSAWRHSIEICTKAIRAKIE
jgi:hypothetical protein